MSLKSLPARQRGSILIVAVWIFALLFLLTISLGRRANHELLFVEYSLQKMQARYLAWAGLQYALEQIRKDSLDEKSKLFDDAYACGVKLSLDQSPEDIFKNIELHQGSFEISFQQHKGDKVTTTYGLRDEDGKLNLNALNLGNYEIFKHLLMTIGVEENQALQIASDALDWRDEDTQAALGKDHAQEGPYVWLQETMPAKNRPFDSLSELKFIKGVTPEMYQKLKELVTIFPRRSEKLQINFSTAPREVLWALARYFAGPLTNSSLVDADSLLDKILTARVGPDKIQGTKDDISVDERKLSLTMPEENIFRAMSAVRTNTSRFLTVHSRGLDAFGRRKSQIDAVIDRETLSIVSWKAD